jgi:hypothetical protein
MHVYKLPLRFDPRVLKWDLSRILPIDWIEHFNKNDYNGQWSVAPLRSVLGDRSLIYPSAVTNIYRDTEILARCPYFREVLAAIECEKTAVRLMKLDPGSEIKEHADSYLSYPDEDVRLHVPIVTNEAIEFYLTGERIRMRVPTPPVSGALSRSKLGQDSGAQGEARP